MIRQLTTSRLTALKLMRDKACKVTEQISATGKPYWVAVWVLRQAV